MESIVRRIYYSFIVLLVLIMSVDVSSAELNNFSWSQTSLVAGDTSSEFIFEYDIVISSPDRIFYAASNGIDTNLLGQPLNDANVSVTINGTPAEINFDTSYNNGNGLYIRLTDPTSAVSGDSIKVVLKSVKNNSIPASYPWTFIRTAVSNGQALDEVTDPRQIELWGYELENASWSNTSSEAGATNVSYQFSYDLVNSSPKFILHTHLRGFWVDGVYDTPVDFSSGGEIVDDSKVKVTVNGTPVEVDFNASW
ncbi:hypothetical protein, partial [Shewanella surugensis]